MAFARKIIPDRVQFTHKNGVKQRRVDLHSGESPA